MRCGIGKRQIQRMENYPGQIKLDGGLLLTKRWRAQDICFAAKSSHRQGQEAGVMLTSPRKPRSEPLCVLSGAGSNRRCGCRIGTSKLRIIAASAQLLKAYPFAVTPFSAFKPGIGERLPTRLVFSIRDEVPPCIRAPAFDNQLRSSSPLLHATPVPRNSHANGSALNSAERPTAALPLGQK